MIMNRSAPLDEINLLWKPHVTSRLDYPSEIEDSEDEYTLIEEKEEEEEDSQIVWEIDKRSTNNKDILLLDSEEEEEGVGEELQELEAPKEAKEAKEEGLKEKIRNTNKPNEINEPEICIVKEDLPDLTQTDTQPTNSPLTSMVEVFENPPTNHKDTIDSNHNHLPNHEQSNPPFKQPNTSQPTKIVKPRRINKGGSLADIINNLNHRGPMKIGLNRNQKIESLHTIKK